MNTERQKRDQILDIPNDRERFLEDQITKEGLADQFSRYLVEFILNENISSFEYLEIDGNGEKRLTSPGFADKDIGISFCQPWVIKNNIPPASIKELIRNIPLEKARQDRLAAEAKGFDLFKQKVFSAPDNSLVVLISPPEKPNGYSVTYFGKISPAQNGQRVVEMVACTNHLSLTQHKAFLEQLGGNINPKIGIKPNKLREEDFLLSPAVVAKTAEFDQPTDLLPFLYSFDNQIAYDVQSKKDIVQRIKNIKEKAIYPYMDELISLFERFAPKQAIDSLINKMELTAIINCQSANSTGPPLTSLFPDNTNSYQFSTEHQAYYQQWLLAHRRLPSDGGSCPAVSRNNLFVNIADQLRNKGADEVAQYIEGLADESDQKKCPGCNKGEKGKYKCCGICKFNS